MPRKKKTPETSPRLSELGAYGFEPQETVLLAALVSEDPLLLIGRSGTGKTFLLNTLSEALGLEHRHYNASLISFDDLVGFPYPDDARESVRFLETPATVWGAQSVLVDEISRCKPEHQNRLFSLVHERCIQGLKLERLRYRWAAMNPCNADQSDGEDYLGSEALDPALADRFALIVEVTDWEDLEDKDRRRIADPAGEGLRADDDGRLAAQVEEWRKQFVTQIECCPTSFIDYACAAASALGEARLRISPRRVRLISRALLAASIVSGETRESVFLDVLRCTLPQRAWGQAIDEGTLRAAHHQAWTASSASAQEKWLQTFHLERRLDRKAKQLSTDCPSPDTGTLAVEQLLSNESPQRAAAFAYAAYPAAIAGKLPVGADAVSDLGRLAERLLDVSGSISWQQRLSENAGEHPGLTAISTLLASFPGARAERARQLFYWCLLEKCPPEDPKAFEAEFNRCVRVFAKAARS